MFARIKDYYTALVRFKHGQELMSQGKFLDAIGEYRKAVLLSPEYAEAYYGLGIAYHCLGRYTDAKRAWLKVLALTIRTDRVLAERTEAKLLNIGWHPQPYHDDYGSD